MNQEFLTPEGLENLKGQIETRKEKRKEISVRIQTAKELGDLSENAEYSEAKDAQAMNESEIARLEDVVKNAKVIKKSSGSTAVIGSTVKVKINKKEMTFTIVGSNEVNPAEGKISNESPIGKAFLGKKKGDKTEIETPKGTTPATILSVS